MTAGHSSEKGWDTKLTMPQAAEYTITSDLNLSEHGDHSEWDNCTIKVYELYKKKALSRSQNNQPADAQKLRQKVTKLSLDFSINFPPPLILSYKLWKKYVTNKFKYICMYIYIYINVL